MPYLTAVESHDYPGFYEIPGFSRYVISKKGELIDRKHGRKRIWSINRGYRMCSMVPDFGACRGCGRHRLLGIVFKHPGIGIDDLVVNQKNGVPGDDDLENLEWVTKQGNIEHAGLLGLTEKCIPISVRDVMTGEVIDYPSCQEYARKVGWSKDKVNWRVRIGETRVFPEMKQYRRSSIKTPWYIPKDPVRESLLNTRSRKILIRNVLTGEVLEFRSLSESARYLKASKAAVCTWLKSPNQPVVHGSFQVKWLYDDTPWRKVNDFYLEHEAHIKKKAIRVIVESTGEERIFSSAKECCQHYGLTGKKLDLRLRVKRKSGYLDGLIISYYSDTAV